MSATAEVLEVSEQDSKIITNLRVEIADVDLGDHESFKKQMANYARVQPVLGDWYVTSDGFMHPGSSPIHHTFTYTVNIEEEYDSDRISIWTDPKPASRSQLYRISLTEGDSPRLNKYFTKYQRPILTFHGLCSLAPEGDLGKMESLVIEEIRRSKPWWTFPHIPMNGEEKLSMLKDAYSRIISDQ